MKRGFVTVTTWETEILNLNKYFKEVQNFRLMIKANEKKKWNQTEKLS